ncbi:MAG: WYL domain-containing protein, partial [Clostridium sp.]|nr:WYL domain-containing protein [Clostridium sp.]
YTDGDPYEDECYITHFHTILTALREKRKLRLRFTGYGGVRQSWKCIPCKLEYSSKDDKFRLLAITQRNAQTVNLARIDSCELLEHYETYEYHPKLPKKQALVMELVDERNALERAMLHFSHLEKETVRLDGSRFQIKLWYDREDEIELLIRVLSFGPMLKVISPERFIEKLKSRLQKQIELRAEN